MIRRIAVLVGLGIIAVGFAFLAVPGIVPPLPMQYVMVSMLGLLALVQGGWIVRNRWRTDTEAHLPPDFERPLSAPTPGADIDRMLYELTQLRQGTIENRERIRERVVEAAIETIRQRDDCSREEAIEKLGEGDWTDDRVATAFLAGQALPATSLTERVRNWLDDQSDYERRVSRTIDAIARAANLQDVAVGEEDDDKGLREYADQLFRGFGLSKRAARTNEQITSWEDDEIVHDYDNVGLHATNRWIGVSAFAFISFGFGLASFEPAMLVAGAVGLLYAGYARSAQSPAVDALEVQRTLSEENPAPGEEVDVTVRVHNSGDSLLPDLRLIDAVPGPMRVVEGSPRIGTALRPGKTVEFSYTVAVSRGEHSWPLYVIARDASGDAEVQTTVDASPTLECIPRLKTTESMTVRDLTTLFSGRIDTSIGGSGVEFFVEREYQPGDPMNRIDWNRRARTGELATLEFREERSANVVLMFDSRKSAYLSPGADQPHAVDRSVDAANDIFAALFDRGDQVGIAAYDTIPCWLAPGADDEHRERARFLLGKHASISSVPPTSGKGSGGYVDPLTHIRRQLANHSQILLFSPLGDDYTAEVARRLDASGHLVTVISPDPTRIETVGQRLARLERQNRIRNLREHGIRVLDWAYEYPFGLALQNAKQRW